MNSSDSPLFRNKLKLGYKLLLSYLSSVQRLYERGNGEETTQLGIISVD